MMSLSFSAALKEVLFLGAHCDDIEIGCGGTMLALSQARPQVLIRAIVFSGNAVRTKETRAAIGRLTAAGVKCELEVLQFRDGFFPAEWAAIKDRFEQLKSRCKPDLIFTHFNEDLHQDHRIVSELTWNTFRNHTILEYEIPKYDGDLGRPQLYFPIAEEVVRLKTAALLESFPSQTAKRWFTEDLFRSLLRLRGMECASPSGFAEAFYARKSTAEW